MKIKTDTKSVLLYLIKMGGGCSGSGLVQVHCKVCPLKDGDKWCCNLSDGTDEKYQKVVDIYIKLYGKDPDLMELLI